MLKIAFPLGKVSGAFASANIFSLAKIVHDG